MRIRREGPEDLAAVRVVEEAAFGRPVEAAIVDALRKNGALTLSLVAENEGDIVGHVAFSPMAIQGEGPPRGILGLGPVAVLPDWQRRGVGAALIKAGLGRLAQDGHEAVLLMGHPTYYPRFGFRPASAWGLRWGGEYPDEAFMALELVPGALVGGGGVVSFRPEFNPA